MSKEGWTPDSMVTAAAQELCRRSSDECGVDYQDNWKIYGNVFTADARAMLDSCGALNLYAALADLVALKDLKDSAEADGSAHERALTLHDYKARQPAAWDRARAALARATGAQS